MKYDFIAIEGNIGVGKTSLAKKLSLDFNANLLLESFSENPFLPKFYKDPKNHAFSLELFFMAERYQQLQKQHKELFSNLIIADYSFIKSKLFAKNNLKSDELKLFYRLFDIMMSSLAKPNLVVYLYANVDRLQSNIKKRGRTFEQNISDTYLEDIQSIYLDYFRKQTEFPVLIIDVTEIDFLKNEDVYNQIKDILNKSYNSGSHHLNLTTSNNEEVTQD